MTIIALFTRLVKHFVGYLNKHGSVSFIIITVSIVSAQAFQWYSYQHLNSYGINEFLSSFLSPIIRFELQYIILQMFIVIVIWVVLQILELSWAYDCFPYVQIGKILINVHSPEKFGLIVNVLRSVLESPYNRRTNRICHMCTVRWTGCWHIVVKYWPISLFWESLVCS